MGMAKSLYDQAPQAARIFDQANAILGYDLKTACFEGPEETLTRTSYCQPALYVHGVCVYELLKERGCLEDLHCVLGLSLGELTALAIAGVYDFETGLRIVAERGRLMEEACAQSEGGMACLIGGTPEEAKTLAQDCDVDLANFNSPGQIVLSGDKAKIDTAVEKAEALSFKRVVPLNVAGAYHSRLMEPAREAFASFLSDIPFAAPTITVFTNTTGLAIQEPEAIKAALAKQVVSSVLWEDCFRNAHALGVDTFYECGPGKVLAGLARRTEKSSTVIPVSEYTDLPEGVSTQS